MASFFTPLPQEAHGRRVWGFRAFGGVSGLGFGV